MRVKRTYLPSDWATQTIGDCCDILDYKRVPINEEARFFRKGSVPYYGANGQQGWIDDFLFDEELVLIAEDGGLFDEYSTRPIAYRITGKSWVNNHAHILRAKSEATNAWVFYNLVHEDIRCYISGGTRAKLTQNELRRIEIPFPEKTEQSRIAAVLDTVDEAIAKTEAVIEKLRQVRMGLLHDLLTCGLDEHGQLRDPIAHREQFQDSPLGRIPKEWWIDTIENSCSHIVDCPHSTPNYLTDGVLVARTMHIRNGRYDVKSSSRLTEEEYGVRIARLEPLPGDVIFTREAPVGEAFVIPPKMRICLGQRVMLLRPTVGKLLGGYLIAQIYSGVVRQRIDRLTGGTTNPHLNVDEAKRFEIPLPKVEEQQKIVDCLSSHDLLFESELAQLGKLHSLKAGLMDDLLTGRVRVTFENVSKMREQERVFSV